MRNVDGSVMASSAVSLTFMIHDGAANGTVIYQEGHALTSNAQGLVSCVVGNGVVSQGNFNSINWGNGAKFLHVMMNGTDLGTQQMLSVPYALHAGNTSVNISATGDTLIVGGNSVIVPGISAANFPPAILGCTDNAACNYSSAATQNDGSCLYQNATCDDGNANTINDLINGSCVCAGTAVGNGMYIQGNGVTDVEGNFYPSIIINGQEWMRQNLTVTKYRNGDPIVTGLNDNTWESTLSGTYANESNHDAYNTLYGKLYNWYAINDSRGLCPTGWHVPSDGEWNAVINYLDPVADGGNNINIAGGKMITLEDNLFFFPGYYSPENESGFSVVASGVSYNGMASYGGSDAYFWSNDSMDFSGAWCRAFYGGDLSVYRLSLSKSLGMGLRCLRDSNLVEVSGCTDSAACNYAVNANYDDGSCLYPNYGCNDGDEITVNDIFNSSCQCIGSLFSVGNGVLDIDNNYYPTIIINGVEWMQQNLTVSRFANGESIANNLDDTSWGVTEEGAFYQYYPEYGKLYNWFAVSDLNGLCPTGWHVPTKLEWNSLINSLGGGQAAGGKLKSNLYWTDPNVGEINLSGFNSLPAGYRSISGELNSFNNTGRFWSKDQYGITEAWHISLSSFTSIANLFTLPKQYGFSVRCIRD